MREMFPRETVALFSSAPACVSPIPLSLLHRRRHGEARTGVAGETDKQSGQSWCAKFNPVLTRRAVILGLALGSFCMLRHKAKGKVRERERERESHHCCVKSMREEEKCSEESVGGF